MVAAVGDKRAKKMKHMRGELVLSRPRADDIVDKQATKPKRVHIALQPRERQIYYYAFVRVAFFLVFYRACWSSLT